jgi:O-antigen/teichoic acid export membrane protein
LVARARRAGRGFLPLCRADDAAGFGLLLLAEQGGWLATDYHWPLVFGALCLPFFAFQDLLEGLARARGTMLRAFVPPYILRVGLLGLSTFGLMAAGYEACAACAMAGALLATILATLIQCLLVLPAFWRERRKEAVPPSERRLWLRATVPLFFADGAQMLRQYADIILLGLLVEPAQLGLYVAVSRITALLGLIEYSVGAMTGPGISVAAAHEDRPALERLLQRSTLLVFWPTLFAGIALVLAGPLLLSLFGTQFTAAAGLIGILVTGPVLRGLAGSAEQMLNMLGHGGATVTAHLLALVCGIAITLLLVPAQGLMGAAIGASVAAAINGAALITLCYRRTGLIGHPWAGFGLRGSAIATP